MITRVAKITLLAGIAFFYSLVVFNNLTDFNSNFEFVRHVLSMDTTFPGNKGMWRAFAGYRIHLAFYVGIILWEGINAILLWWGVARLLRRIKLAAGPFNAAKGLPIVALTLSMSMWLVAFLCVGGEWFLMWQSRIWNGQEAAFRMFTVVGVVLLIVLHVDSDTQP